MIERISQNQPHFTFLSVFGELDIYSNNVETYFGSQPQWRPKGLAEPECVFGGGFNPKLKKACFLFRAGVGLMSRARSGFFSHVIANQILPLFF